MYCCLHSTAKCAFKFSFKLVSKVKKTNKKQLEYPYLI